VDQVKALFVQLLGLSEDEIDEDHPEIRSFAGLPVEGMVDRLYAGASRHGFLY